MQNSRLLVLLANLGTPAAATPAAVRAFLKPFLSDPRVVEVPRPIWWLILNAFILPFRPKPVAQAYQALWDHYGDSPLRLITAEQVDKLTALCEQQFGAGEVLVDYCFTYGEPSLAAQLDRYRSQVDKIVLLPLYPQYSCSTTAALSDQLAAYQRRQRHIADVALIKDYYQTTAYRQALADSVQRFWQQNGRGDFLLVSCHGVPKAYADKGDPYYRQCLATAQQLAADLGLADGSWRSSFQSRLGKAEWLKPYTDVTVRELAAAGVKTLDVVCPSFSVDCLETLEEIAVENAGYFREAGGETLRLVPCLNADDAHVAMMLSLITPYRDLLR